MKNRYKIVRILFTVFLIASGVMTLGRTVLAEVGEQIQVQKVKRLDDIDINLKNWADYSEENKMSLVKNASTGEAVFCIEPKKDYPSNGSYLTVKSRLENKTVANLILNYQNQKEYISSLNEDAQYAATQCAIFYVVAGEQDDLMVDPVVEKLIDYAKSLPDPMEQMNNFSFTLTPEHQNMQKDKDHYTATYALNTEAATLSESQVAITSNDPEAQAKADYRLKDKTLEIRLPADVVDQAQKNIAFTLTLTGKLTSTLQLAGYLAPEQVSRQHMASLQAFQLTSDKRYSAQVQATLEKPVLPVEVPAIQTQATNGAKGTKEIPAEKTTIKDQISYQHLIPGKNYQLSGILMDKATGKPLLIAGKEVQATKAFTPTQATGEETVTFTLDATTLAGKQLVVFETLTQEGNEVAKHQDINDDKQTVSVDEPPTPVESPTIKTEAANGKDGTKQIPAGKTEIKDQVRYDHLIPGKNYQLSGLLMDQASGKPLLIAGKEVQATKAFTPRQATGEETVSFTLDATTLSGKQLVVFETLTQEGNEVAKHQDINDDKQTVTVADPPTTVQSTTSRTQVTHDKEGTKQVPATSSSQRRLPKTGETSAQYLVVLGIGLIFSVSFIIVFTNKRKNRKKK
jgi:LPXTG-motif cell wall-anchored protein